jgi:hypothetical protein
MGAESIKAMAAERGTPLEIKRRVIGTIPHSQARKKTPAPIADRTDKIGFLGMIFAIISSDTKIWMIPDIRTPSKMKGRDSIRILIKIVFICKRA